MKERKVSVVEMLKKHRQNFSKPILLSTNHWAWLRPVSASIISEAQTSISSPPVPKWFNEDKDREEENPNDPAYQLALLNAEAERNNVGIESMIMFGVDLCDSEGTLLEAPPEGEWLGKLKYMERKKMLDLSEYNLDDDFDVMFLYKKYIAVSAMDIPLISAASGVSEEDISDALASFPASEA